MTLFVWISEGYRVDIGWTSAGFAQKFAEDNFALFLCQSGGPLGG